MTYRTWASAGMLAVAGSLGTACLAWAQESAVSPEQVARTLVSQKHVVVIAAKGKAKSKIEKEAPKHRLANGESPVALFRLPDYSGPYSLKVTSLCNCVGFRKSMLVPSGVFLDEQFGALEHS